MFTSGVVSRVCDRSCLAEICAVVFVHFDRQSPRPHRSYFTYTVLLPSSCCWARFNENNARSRWWFLVRSVFSFVACVVEKSGRMYHYLYSGRGVVLCLWRNFVDRACVLEARGLRVGVLLRGIALGPSCGALRCETSPFLDNIFLEIEHACPTESVHRYAIVTRLFS